MVVAIWGRLIGLTSPHRLVEITAADTSVGTGRYAQFIVGRIIVYVSVGLVEVNVT